MKSALIWLHSEALYLGPTAGLAAAPSQTFRLYAPVDGPVFLEEGSRRLQADVGGVLVTSGEEDHRIGPGSARAACLLLDRAVHDPDRVRRVLEAGRDAGALRDWIGALRDSSPAVERRPAFWPVLFGPVGRPRADDAMAHRMRAALRVVRRDPAAPDALERAADAAGWSQSRLRHLARERTGLSLKRYRLWAKLARAIALARSGENLTAAALGAGFSSSSHLSAAHAAMFGLSPSALLKGLASPAPSPYRAPGVTAPGAAPIPPRDARVLAGPFQQTSRAA